MARSVEEAIDELMRVDDDGDEYELSTSSEEEVDDLTTSVPGSDLTVNAAHSQSFSRASSSVETALPSLLSRLRPPTSSELSRKRVIDHTASIQIWSNTAQNVLLLQPSSAAAERVFSVLNNTFARKQLRALEDYVEASIMLQYNKRE